jgi:ABC-type methionine transport system ATPase subunit
VQALSDLNKKQGLTVIMISHEESLLDEFADDVIHLQDGIVIQEERIR